MQTRRIGIIMNGVTGRMGANQHLARSITAIIKQGGIRTDGGLVIMPDPILTGRREDALKHLAEKQGALAGREPYKYTTDLEGALNGKHGDYEVFFDASVTTQRVRFLEMAVQAGKAIYCEKPTAESTAEAVRMARIARDAGLKNGVVQDKLWLPGLRKLRMLMDCGFFGRIVSIKADFGYWVFSGMDTDQPAQRPSWNYRAEDGGGVILDMFCHWRYVIDNLFGNVRGVMACGTTGLEERRDETGLAYKCTAEDIAFATFLIEGGAMAQFNSSWCTRVRRDDLLSIQVDGVKGSAVAGLRGVKTQSAANTPRPEWNPDVPQPINFYDNWADVPDNIEYDNAFKIQWEMFIKHVVLDTDWKYTLMEGAKGVQLAELGIHSWKERRWVDVPELT